MTKDELDAIALEVAGEVYKIRNVETLSMASGAQTFAHCFLERIKGKPVAWRCNDAKERYRYTKGSSGWEPLYTLPEIRG